MGHVCLEAGRRFAWPEEPCHLVVLAVPNTVELQKAIERIQLAGIKIAVFCEPDDDLGITAACTEPIIGPARHLFKRFALWREPEINTLVRGPPVQTKR